MKQNIIFFSLFFCMIAAEAQTYIPFPTNNSSWVESRTFRRQGFPTYVNCFQMLTRIDQDTIMSGLQYHRLYQVFIDYTDHTQCISNTYDSIMYYGGYIRNDSLNKKVYFKLSPSSPDTLLYDFDLKLGQLYPPTYLSNANPSLVSDSVVNIDSVFINSQWHKRFTLTKNKSNCNNPSTYYLIEGVGSSSGFWSAGNCDTLYQSALECMSIGNLAVYPNQQNSACTLITGLTKHKIENQELILSPNPTLGWVNIQDNITIKNIVIYNAHGQEIREVEPLDQKFKLPEQSGIYIIRIQNDKGEFYSNKIIKR